MRCPWPTSWTFSSLTGGRREPVPADLLCPQLVIWVHDSSSVLCWLNAEPGGVRVSEVLATGEPAFIHAVNLVEVRYHYQRRGEPALAIASSHLAALGIEMARIMDVRSSNWPRISRLSIRLLRLAMSLPWRWQYASEPHSSPQIAANLRRSPQPDFVPSSSSADLHRWQHSNTHCPFLSTPLAPLRGKGAGR